MKTELESKSVKIKDSKRVLNEYLGRIKTLVSENEKLKALGVGHDLSQVYKGDVNGPANPASISKEKLIYELGGRDGANTALKFIDTYAA
jgi:hypothetical protein